MILSRDEFEQVSIGQILGVQTKHTAAGAAGEDDFSLGGQFQQQVGAAERERDKKKRRRKR